MCGAHSFCRPVFFGEQECSQGAPFVNMREFSGCIPFLAYLWLSGHRRSAYQGHSCRHPSSWWRNEMGLGRWMPVSAKRPDSFRRNHTARPRAFLSSFLEEIARKTVAMCICWYLPFARISCVTCHTHAIFFEYV